MKKLITVICVVLFAFIYSGCLSDKGWKNVNTHMQRQSERNKQENQYYQNQYQKNYPYNSNDGRYKKGKEK